METNEIEEEREKVSNILSERLEAHDESRKAAQEKLHNFCDGLRAQVDKLENRVNSELGEKFTAEDDRLQSTLSELNSCEDEGISRMIQKAKAELLLMQSYELVCHDFGDDSGDEEDQKMNFDLSSMCKLKTERKVVHDIFEERKPTNLIPSFTEKWELSLSFAFFNEDEVEVLKELKPRFEVEMKVWEKGHEEESTSRTLTKEFTLGHDEPICFRSTFAGSTTYCLNARIAHQGTRTQWSDEIEFTTPKFKGLCVWKECPYNVNGNRKYSVDMKNPRIATKVDDNWCTIIGNTPLPLNKVTSWNIKILKSRNNDGSCIWIGVAPSNINQNIRNCDKCGWYYYCYSSRLCSGPPHNYSYKDYGPRKEMDNTFTQETVLVL